MATDWVATLKEQSRIVQQLAEGVAKATAHPDLTLYQASQIYGIVERGAVEFDRIMTDMNRHILNDRLYVAADRLRDIWTALLVMADNKMRTLKRLEPVELSDGHEE
jgi:hypothetical protein